MKGKSANKIPTCKAGSTWTFGVDGSIPMSEICSIQKWRTQPSWIQVYSSSTPLNRMIQISPSLGRLWKFCKLIQTGPEARYIIEIGDIDNDSIHSKIYSATAAAATQYYKRSEWTTSQDLETKKFQNTVFSEQ